MKHIYPKHSTKRGGTRKHPLYATYFNMLMRCKKENYEHFDRYGGRGIKVCEKWDSENGFLNFINDMGERPENYQLDRIDNNGDYEPSNCRWIDKYTQMGNTSATKIYPGVSFHKLGNKWRARIKINGSEVHLGLFKTIKDAIKARKRYELCDLQKQPL